MDIQRIMLNLLHSRFSEVDFEYNKLTEEEQVWCTEDEYNEILKLINKNRMRIGDHSDYVVHVETNTSKSKTPMQSLIVALDCMRLAGNTEIDVTILMDLIATVHCVEEYNFAHLMFAAGQWNIKRKKSPNFEQYLNDNYLKLITNDQNDSNEQA